MVWSPGWLYSPKKHVSLSTPGHGTSRTSSRYGPQLSKLDIALSLIPPQPDGNCVGRSKHPVYCHLADSCLRSLITVDGAETSFRVLVLQSRPTCHRRQSRLYQSSNHRRSQNTLRTERK